MPVLFSGGSLPKNGAAELCLSAADFVAAGYFFETAAGRQAAVLAVVNPLLGGSKAAELMPKDYHLAGNVETAVLWLHRKNRSVPAGSISAGTIRPLCSD